MRKNWVFALFLTFFLVPFTALPAMAGEEHDGFYLGIGIVYNAIVGSDLDTYDPAAGLDVKIGYNFGWIALELGKNSAEHSSDVYTATYDYDATTLSLKAYYIPPRKTVRGYFVFGVGEYDLRGTPKTAGNYSGSGVHFGPGLEVFMGDHAALNFSITYRDVTFDGYRDITVYPELDGSSVATQLGVNFYF